MPGSAAESLQHDRMTRLGPTGTVVLSSSCRLLGLNSHHVRVEGFSVPCSQRQETRIVLVLFPCELGVP